MFRTMIKNFMIENYKDFLLVLWNLLLTSMVNVKDNLEIILIVLSILLTIIRIALSLTKKQKKK